MKYFLLVCFIIFCCASADAQQRWWSFTNNGWTATKTVELPDHTYLCVGNIDKRFDGIKNPITRGINLVKFSKNGKILDSAFIRINKIDSLNYLSTETSYQSAVQLIGNYIYLGINELDTNDYYPDYLIRFPWDFKQDSSGFIYPEIINQIHSGNYITNIYSIQRDTIGRFLVLSFYQNSSAHYVFYSSLTCFDSSFHQLWKKDFKADMYDDLFPEQLIGDGKGGYLLVCQRQIYYQDIDPNIYQQFVYRLDSNGNQKWRLDFTDDSFSLYNMRISPIGNDSFVACYTDQYTNGNLYPNGLQQGNFHCTLRLCPFSLTGKKGKEKYLNQYIQWKTGDSLFNGTNTDMTWDEQHNFYLAGYYHHQDDYAYMFRFKPDLTPVWFRKYNLLPDNHPTDGGWVSNYPYTMTRTSDKGFLLTGEYQSMESAMFPQGTQQGMVIKLDSFGCLEGGCEMKDGIREVKEQSNELIQVYPNPASNVINIKYDLKILNLYMTVSDISGRIIKQKFLQDSSGLGTIDMSDVKPGLYFISEYVNGQLLSVQKQVIQ